MLFLLTCGDKGGEKVNTIAVYLAKLVRAQLQDEVPANMPEELSIEQLMKIAVKNQMIVLLLGGVIKTDLADREKEIIRPVIKQSLLRSFIQSSEFTEIEKQFEKEKIIHQPMKGAYLKDIYPRPTLREMSDLDILIREESMERAGELLSQMGYILKQEIKHHDIYEKKPYLIVEAHRALYDKLVDKNQYDYFSDFSRAVKKEGCEYTYNFSKEDFYIYMLAHMAKHFYEKGCGIRNLVDIYIYRNHYKNQLDELYIESQLEKCGILTFTRHMEKLTGIWLEDEESSHFYDVLFEYMLDGGVYGNDENGIWNEFSKEKDETEEHYNKKLKRFYYFPPMHYMMHYYPWIKNNKLLLLLAWIIRGMKGIFHFRKSERNNLVQNIDKGKIKTMQNIYKTMDFKFHQ